VKRLLLLALTTTAVAIDFTPARSVRQLEGGFSVPVLTFDAGGRRVSYKPPARWTSVGTPETLTLTPTTAGATMKLTTLRWSADEAARVAAPEAEQKWALRFLPPEATEAEVATVHESPFMLGRKPSREWIIKYRLGDMTHTLSVARCDVAENERLVVLIGARSQDFEAVRRDGVSSLFRWEWL
jgi:hypothetical protein